MTDSPESQHQGQAADETQDLRARLNDVTAELQNIARRRLRRLPNSWTPTIERRCEELEEEADRLRSRLGEPPAPGRPPRSTWVGWFILMGTVILVAVAVAAFNWVS